MYIGCYAVYSVILLIAGKTSLKERNALRYYYFGNRKLKLSQSVVSFLGTWISAATVLGFTGNVFETGILPLLYSVVPWFLGALLLRHACDRIYACDVMTVPALFAKRYGAQWMQPLCGMVCCAAYTLYISIHIKGFGVVAAGLFGIPYQVAALMIYLFLLYVTLGGYLAVTRVDAFHILILTIGTLLAAVLVLRQSGGLTALWQALSDANRTAVSAVDVQFAQNSRFQARSLLLGRPAYTPLMIFSTYFSWGLGLAANPQYIIRILSADSARTARRMLRWSLWYLGFFYAALFLIGIGMRALYPSLAGAVNADDIVTAVLNGPLFQLPNMLFFFAVLGVCVSSASAQLLLFAMSFSYDLMRPLADRAGTFRTERAHSGSEQRGAQRIGTRELEGADGAERPNRMERPDGSERLERMERSERAERPEKADRAENQKSTERPDGQIAFFGRFSEYRTIQWTKIGVLVGASFAFIGSMQTPQDLLSYGGDIWGIFSILFLPLLYGGLYLPHAGKRSAAASFAAGLLALAVCYPLYGMGILPVHPAMPGVLSSGFAFLITAQKEQRGMRKQGMQIQETQIQEMQREMHWQKPQIQGQGYERRKDQDENQEEKQEGNQARSRERIPEGNHVNSRERSQERHQERNQERHQERDQEKNQEGGGACEG